MKFSAEGDRLTILWMRSKGLSAFACLICLASTFSRASDTSEPTTRAVSPFVFVFIDKKTEAKLGPFPYDRSVYAKAIRRAADQGARGVVLKFFLDLPKSTKGDQELAAAVKSTKVILQAALDDTVAHPNELPPRFKLAIHKGQDTQTLSGETGMLPLPALAACAYDLGFVDYKKIDRVQAIERYRGDYVKSLFTCCIELASGQSAKIIPGRSITLGSKVVALGAASDLRIQYPAVDDLSYISLVDFLAPGKRQGLKDKVIILGYDGERFAPVVTPAGKLRPHRAFCYALLSMYSQTCE